MRQKIALDETGTFSSQTIKNLEYYVKNFAIFLKCTGKPSEYFEWRNDVIRFSFMISLTVILEVN